MTNQHNKITFVDVAAQHVELADELNRVVASFWRNPTFILGKHVEEFEKKFADFCGTRFAIGVDSGLEALRLSLLAHGVGPGDEVIAPANTFIATLFAISHTGARPVLVDAREDTALIDVAEVKRRITPNTKAIIPVHLYGQVAPMDELLDLARAKNIIIVEDACQAHGAEWNGKRAGSFGNAGAFSFYPGKNLGAAGDGGMVTTNDERIAGGIRQLRNYGQSQKYRHESVGYNSRLDALQAAVLSVKLPHLLNWNELRRSHAATYKRLLAEKVGFFREVENGMPVFHLFVIRTKLRDELKTYLYERDIETGIHYPIPVHLQPAYAALGYRAGDFPVTEKLASEILSLPMHPYLTEDDVAWVSSSIGEFVRQTS